MKATYDANKPAGHAHYLQQMTPEGQAKLGATPEAAPHKGFKPLTNLVGEDRANKFKEGVREKVKVGAHHAVELGKEGAKAVVGGAVKGAITAAVGSLAAGPGAPVAFGPAVMAGASAGASAGLVNFTADKTTAKIG
jgi:hypothetical protein